jgi:hypothetical protein
VSPTANGAVTGVTPSLCNACLVIDKSATGPTSCVNVATLFDRSVSAASVVTDAAFAVVCPAMPPASSPVIVIVCGPSVTASDARVHTTEPPAPPEIVQLKPPPEAPVAVNCAGRGSLTTTPVAVSGPWFLTVTVKVSAAPALGFAEPVLSIVRSALAGAVTVALALLLAASGSGVGLEMLASFVSTAGALATVAVIVIVTVDPAVTVPREHATVVSQLP